MVIALIITMFTLPVELAFFSAAGLRHKRKQAQIHHNLKKFNLYDIILMLLRISLDSKVCYLLGIENAYYL